MIDWQVKHMICGLAELDSHADAGITHVLSILDPEMPDPDMFARMPDVERLTLRFHDVIVPYPGQVLPARGDVEALLAFGRSLPDRDPRHLLVHCHMGISRSVAAMAAIMIQAQPELDEDDVMNHLLSLRPKAWPNSIIIEHADALLERQGRLIAAAARLYRRQLDTNPRFAEPLRTSGRGAEVEMAERLSA